VFFPRPDRAWWRTWGLWGGICLLGLLVTALCLPPPVPKVIRLAAGTRGGGYDAFARALKPELAKDGFRLEIVPTAGSVENLRLLEARRVDVALVQGGTVGRDRDDLRSVCSVFFEPLWVLHGTGIAMEDLRDLRGKRVAVGAQGSGTRVLAVTLLRANGLGPDDVRLSDLGGEAAARALERGEVDAVFAVLSARAPWLADALARPGVRLFDCARHETYARRWSYLHALTVTPGLLDLARDVPAVPTRVVAPAAALVFQPHSHRGLVPPLVEAARRIERRDALFAPAGTFPSPRYVDAPLDEDARRYLQQGPSFLYRVFPIAIAQVIDRLKIFLIPLLTLLIPIFKLAPPLYRWRMRARIYRWYRILREAEELLIGTEPGANLPAEIEKLDALEAEISGVDVPLSYADELYNLHLHVDYVRNKLRARAAPG
jgi:TRAP transporter TAXI family solute receptor